MSVLSAQMIDTLRQLANKYETPRFLEGDPSCFMHRYADPRDQEVVAFLAANLALGRREQILRHVETLLCHAGRSPADWIADGGYRRFFADSGASFYRMFSHATMRLLCGTLRQMLRSAGTLGAFFRREYGQAASAGAAPHLSAVIARAFPAECTIICHGRTSAAKRLQMFLRWMVRGASPVDLGLWEGWYSRAALLIPLDTHVLQQSARLGLLSAAAAGRGRTPAPHATAAHPVPANGSGHAQASVCVAAPAAVASCRVPAPSLRLAIALTAVLGEAFPGDPVRGDYALFGLGVDTAGFAEIDVNLLR